MGSLVASALVGLVVLAASPAAAVVRSCGPDPVQNTADVLCAPPSGPCTATSVTIGASVEVPDGGRCPFDLGGRTLVVERTLAVTGQALGLNGTIAVFNANDILVTDTGKLKARGDFVQPRGFILSGGLITLAAEGAVTIAGVLDVTGDSAGEILIEGGGDVTIAATAHVRGNGLSSFLDEGERFADAAVVLLESLGGSVRVYGDVTLNGQSLGESGVLEAVAARDVLLAHKLSLTGYFGGTVDAHAGDDVTVTHAIDVDGTGDGSGGEIVLDAGNDSRVDARPGGSVLLDGTTITMRGAAEDELAGDGGELTISSAGDITLTDVVIRGDAVGALDGSGGIVDLDATESGATPIGPLDGSIAIDGLISLRGGNGFDGGFGGEFAAFAGRDLIQRAVIDTSSITGGEIDLGAKGSVFLEGPLRNDHPQGEGGDIYVDAGLGSPGGVFVHADVVAASGSEGLPFVLVAGCSLTVAPGVTIDARAHGPGPILELRSIAPMQLGKGSRYLVGPTGSVELVSPPGVEPVIGDDVVFDPEPTRIVSTSPFPPCPPSGCGNGILEAGEECDDGNVLDRDGCSPQCKVQCEPRPRLECSEPVEAGRAVLELRNVEDDARDRLVWRWLKGARTTRDQLGSPMTVHDYALCIYDRSVPGQPLIFEAVAPAGGLCDGRPCWTENARGIVYEDAARTPSGLQTLRLETGDAGEAKTVALAKGVEATLPPLPLPLPLVVQVQGSHGACFTAAYHQALKNTGSRFEAVAD